MAAEALPDSAMFHRVVAAALALSGRIDDANTEGKRIMKLEPDFTIAKFLTNQPYKRTPAVERYLDGLRAAGIPEE